MNKKTTDMVAYVTWVGLLIAFIAGDREKSKFHLNQALVVWLVGFLSVIPIVRKHQTDRTLRQACVQG